MKKPSKKRIRGFSIAFIVGIIVYLLSYFAIIIFFQISGCIEITQNINDPKIKTELRSKFDRDYNYTELFLWEHENLNFTWEEIERHTDPIEILEYGKGRCEEFAILYAALCSAHGYETKFVANIFGDHQWTTIKVGEEWIHFDPSLSVNDSRINDPLMYERDWNANLCLVLEFEDSTFRDVSSSYRTDSYINLLSIEMFSRLSISVFLILLAITCGPTRKLFYKAFFRKEGILHSIGYIYEKLLRALYIMAFVFLFILPLAIAAFFTNIRDQNVFLNLILIGFAIVTFSAIEMPALTKPNFFISILEDCLDEKECTLKSEKKPSDPCKYKDGKVCKKDERCLRAEVGKRVILFRVVNLNLHTLKNCAAIFIFPRNIELIDYNDPINSDEDFKKKYIIQERNNACLFSPRDNYLSFPPTNCIIFPVVVNIKQKDETHKIGIEFFSESTWGSSSDTLKIKCKGA